ncbi:TonB-dependent receptor [Massilia agilis]|uniref:TonB-dependent receptor n=1 Tax=Massilia agilis TaxID=1811226 RepID=A0ABT2DDM4_9BURK|nr:TonB-dependent receptor [Massilia agilis]MCS0809321.1 TonB-dependent receptor [Massilia agilis]
MMRTKPCHRLLIAAALLAAFGPARGQSGGDATPTVVVLGSRAPAKTALETAVPVGLVSLKDMQSTGMLELGKVLQDLDPSFNFSTTFISDGTDIIRPATLRGLGPDQLLVLVNGKRRHQQALVNVQQTIGRGSAGTDINAIPLSAIDHIEVLRDGAAAQYGSDAIAGVINIVLKKGAGKGQLSATGGATSEGDGKQVGASAWRGFALGDGYIDLAVEARKRGETNRAGADSLRVQPPRVTQRIGDSLAKDAYLWLNSVLPTSTEGEFYAFGGVSRRRGDAGGFFRPKGDGRNVPAVYPDGFLPNILTTVRDASLALGYRHALGGQWDFDASVNHGRNELAFHERNSINVSYWYEPQCSCSIYGESPREADTGKLRFKQTTVNLDVKGPMMLLGFETFVAIGAEYRREGYQIVAGEPVSYQYGRTNNTAIKILDQTGHIAAAGIQGFPGYTPSTEVNESRHNVALYLDLEQKFGKSVTIGSALRRERYSDFGDTTTGKMTLRWDPLQQFGLRGSASTGFRAPGVQQKFYSSVSTNLNAAGVLTDTLTAREGSAVTRAFGIAPLKQEQSRSYSAGIVLRPARDLTLTADVYRTLIYDRIVFSSNIEPETGACLTPAACPVKAILAPLRVGQAQFFTNAIDTATRGLDIVLEKTLRGSAGKLVLSGQLGLNRTEVTGRHSSSPVLSGAQLFDDAQVTLIERGQPRQHHVVAADFSTGPWELNARANYYGKVEGQGFTAPYIQTWEGKWLADLSARYAFSRQLSFSAGANNVFDTYPTRWDPVKAAPFPQLGFTYCWESCPFGINGRSMYVRADYSF